MIRDIRRINEREHGNEASVTPALESMGTRLVMKT